MRARENRQPESGNFSTRTNREGSKTAKVLFSAGFLCALRAFAVRHEFCLLPPSAGDCTINEGISMQTETEPPVNRFDALASRLPLLWASLGFLAGILLASQLDLPAWVWGALAGLFLLLAILSRRPSLPIAARLPLQTILLACLALSTLALGGLRFRLSEPVIDAQAIAWYADREYETLVTGRLVGPPDERDTYTNLRIRVSNVDTGDEWLPVEGLLLARIPPGDELEYGDVVRLRGHVRTPPTNEEFSYKDYLARQGIHAYMPDAVATRLPFQEGSPFLRWVYRFKAASLECIYAIFPDPEASLLAGILLGEDQGLSAGLQQAFKDTGTAHIIAISGFNIAIIAGLFVTLFSRLLGPRRGALAAVIGIAVYTLLVGADASVVRAALMGSLAIFARQFGRRQSAVNTLAFSGALMCLINPNTLWDVGFQLSFFATLGLILYASPLQTWAVDRLGQLRLPLPAEKIARPLSEYVLFTLAAQLTTLPIMAWHFHRISLVSLIANPFILPAQPPVMILGGLAVLLALPWRPLGQVFAWIAWPFPAYTIRAVEFFDRLPGGVIVLGDFSLLLVILFYALLFGWTFGRERFKRLLTPALQPAALLTGLGVLTFLVWRAVFAAPDGRLHLIFLDAGSAEAVLIRMPSGGTLLVNGGSSPSMLADGLGRRLSPFDRTLDWLVVAAPQEEQVAALPRIVDRFPPAQVLWSGNSSASYSAGELERWLADAAVPVVRAQAGTALDLGGGARLSVLAVTPRGAVLLVEWQGFRALLPSGLNFDSLEALGTGEEIGQVTVLLLAGSGYGPLNPEVWLENLSPQIAVLSVAAGDPAGLPDESVLAALSGSTLLRTDRNGWIEVSTDGEQLWVAVDRK
jgi:competence protein ComEC